MSQADGREGRRDRNGEDERADDYDLTVSCGILMKTLAIIIALLIVAGAIGYALLEKRPGYGAYYGLAKLPDRGSISTGSSFATLTRHAHRTTLVCSVARWSECQRTRSPRLRDGAWGIVGAAENNRAVRTELPRSLLRAEWRPHRTYPATHAADALSGHDRYSRCFPVGDNRSTLAIYSRSWSDAATWA